MPKPSEEPDYQTLLLRLCEELGVSLASIDSGGRFLESCLAVTPALMYTIDQDARICEVSDLWLQRFGFSREQVIGHSPMEFLDEESRKRATENLARLKQMGACRDIPYRFLTRAGEGVDVLLSAGSEKDADGQVVRSQAVLTEVTEFLFAQREAELSQVRVREAEQLASAAVASKVSLLQTLSHELRTPIYGILGSAQLLSDSEPREDQVSLLDALGSSAKHLLRLVDDVLDLARIESGRLEVVSEPIELGPLMEELLKVHGTTAEAKGIALQYEPDADLPRFLSSDSTRLRQVLHNLLSNGIKYTAEGSVTLAVKRPSAGRLRFEVQDTGPGIADEFQGRVFEAFERGEEETARLGGGTGLGLPIAKRIAQAMQGDLFLQSTVGQGSCFSLEMPIEELDSLPDHEDPEGARLDEVQVLLVEDNPVNAMVAMRTMQAVGAQVTHVASGLDALDQVAKGSFDVVLMDLTLTDMAGTEAVRMIRALPNASGALPILAFSAKLDDEAQAQALAAGMDGFIPKPIELKRLRMEVMAAVGLISRS